MNADKENNKLSKNMDELVMAVLSSGEVIGNNARIWREDLKCVRLENSLKWLIDDVCQPEITFTTCIYLIISIPYDWINIEMLILHYFNWPIFLYEKQTIFLRKHIVIMQVGCRIHTEIFFMVILFKWWKFACGWLEVHI